ncbi:MAG TPA: NAD(P)H-dependent oxidoreductase subunit E [Actinomycetota bacterium]|nr:NAD(P)H-dependent oxidoreductase subunit E [Actinomycetota bacterium]
MTGPLPGPAVQEILGRYPAAHQRSAVMPLLRLAQEREGHVTQEAMHEIAGILGLTPAEVLAVATFYSIFHLKPKGRHVISVCHNLSCSLMGAEEILEHLEEALGVGPDSETTPDGAFTLEHAECLAACDIAPCVQVDYDRMLGPVTPRDVDALLAELRTGAGGAA